MIGIDLGTSNSCMAEFKGNVPSVLRNSIGELITPTYLAFAEGKIMHGVAAKNQQILNPQETFYSTKRLIGRRFDEPEVEREISLATYGVRNEDNEPVLRSAFGDMTPTEVASLFLKEMTSHLPSRDAVITVPAYFNNSQKEETERAAELAGLNVVRLLTEPTSAALAYDFTTQNRAKDELLLIVDLGAGTFDVSVVDKSNGVYQVISSAGNNFFGGDDYTARIFNAFAENRQLPAEMRAELQEVSELCKIELSKTELFSHPRGSMTRTHYESLVADLDRLLEQPIKRALSDANTTSDRLSKVLLVGGQTREPSVQKFIADLLRRKPLNVLDPDLCVAQGAAVQHAIAKKQLGSLLLLDVAPLSLGIETLGGAFSPLIPRNSPIPTRESQIFTTTEDDEESVKIAVFQGERALAKNNYYLGEFVLKGIQKAKKSVPRIEVVFEIDQNGLLKVSAKDADTGQREEIVLEGGKNSTQEEVDEAEKQHEKEIIEKELLRREITDLGGILRDSMDVRELRALKSRLHRRRE